METVLQKICAPTGSLSDAAFRFVVFLAATLLVVLVAAMLLEMALTARLSITQLGWALLTGRNWDPARGQFGSLPFIFGTVLSSLIALVLAVPLSLGVAVYLTEQATPRVARPIGFFVETLAAIPSVVYGLWGIFVLAPFMREYAGSALARFFGWTPLFQGTVTGLGMLTAGVILALMITPIITSVTREVLRAVPVTQREAALALGATPWEATLIVLQNAASGIAGAVILGLGRAIGETMAVTMLIGNRPEINFSLFAPGYTIASVIANEFTEASGELYQSALVQIGLLLFLVTFVINAGAKLLVLRVTRRQGKG